MELTKDNFLSFNDLTVFAPSQLIKLFLTIPKAKTLDFLRSFENDFREKIIEEAPDYIRAQ